MATYVSENRKEFEIPGEGLYVAVCIDVVERGLVETAWGVRDEVELRWELEETDSRGKPFQVRQRYRRSLNEKAKLRQHLELWRGTKFSPKDLQKFDLDTLIGVNCQIQIVHNLDADGRTWANVQAIIKAPKNVTLLKPSPDYVREKLRPKPQDPGPAHVEPAKPAETDDDIPFAWVLPFVLPLTTAALLGGIFA